MKGILNIVNYFSKVLFGTQEDPQDVEIKLLIEDEPAPYWHIEINGGYDFKELQMLNDFVESEGYVLELCLDGIWVSTKESYEKRK